MLPLKMFGKLDSQKRHIPLYLDRTQLIYTCILFSFSLSLVIHDYRAGVQRFMIPRFLKQIFKILTWFVNMIHDSWFRFHPRKLIETYAEFIVNLIHPVQGFVLWKFQRMSLALGLIITYFMEYMKVIPPRCKVQFYPSIHPSIHPSVRPSVRPSVHPSIYLIIHSFVRLLIQQLTLSIIALVVCFLLSPHLFYLRTFRFVFN